jgi:archaemetzincin
VWVELLKKLLVKNTNNNNNRVTAKTPRRNVVQRVLFTLAIVCMSVACTQKRVDRVGIQSLGKFEGVLVDSIGEAIRSSYGFYVEVLPQTPMPRQFFVNIKSPRYRADSILVFLRNNKPSSVDLVLGLTRYDISITDRDWTGRVKEPSSKYADWGVFGYGFQPGVSSVVSTFRIQHKNPSVTIERLIKICLHEVGHNLGLRHCESDHCFMKDAAEKISTIDQVDRKLCSACKRKLD